MESINKIKKIRWWDNPKSKLMIFIRIVVLFICLVCGGFYYHFIIHIPQVEILSISNKQMSKKIISLTNILINNRNLSDSTMYAKELDTNLIKEYLMTINNKMYQSMADYIVNSILKASRKYHIDPELILAIIRTESNGDPFIVSNKNAFGLMQVRPFNSQKKSVWYDELENLKIISRKKDLYDPKNNVMAGCYVLHKYYMNSKGNLKIALKKYNGSSNNVYYEKVIKNLGGIRMFQIRYNTKKTEFIKKPEVKNKLKKRGK